VKDILRVAVLYFPMRWRVYAIPETFSQPFFPGFSLCALAQEKNLTDVQRMDLGGSVKSVSVHD
jgi:hypothetical protein